MNATDREERTIEEEIKNYAKTEPLIAGPDGHLEATFSIDHVAAYVRSKLVELGEELATKRFDTAENGQPVSYVDLKEIDAAVQRLTKGGE